MAQLLRLGVIGASAERGWAKISHVPAIHQLDGLELAAVVTQDSLPRKGRPRLSGRPRDMATQRHCLLTRTSTS